MPKISCKFPRGQWVIMIDWNEMAEWCHMMSQNLVNISSCNSLQPDDAKPLPELMLNSHQWGLARLILGLRPVNENKVSHWMGANLESALVLGHSPEGISLELLKISILDLSLKITASRFHPHIPWTNELTHWPLGDFTEILDKLFSS